MYTTIGLVLLGFHSLMAQSIPVEIATGAAYAKNVWYQLETDTKTEASATNWDLALSTSISQTNPLTTAIRFNHKSGLIYEFPVQVPLDFETVDTAGFSSWSPLYNHDTTWSIGALNATTPLGTFDYGWGTYNMTTHSGIQANRVFLIRFLDGTFKKLMIDLTFSTQSYTIKQANLDNSNMEESSVSIAGLSGKNFIYFSLNNGVQDREPLSNDWDLTFMQYPSFDFNPPYMVTGILQNVGVLATKVHPVDNVSSFVDYQSASLSDRMNIIGYDWKSFAGSWVFEDSTVYFVQDKSGSIWKIIMTNFGGSATGVYAFTKEKMTNASINELPASAIHLYPNPSNDQLTLVTAGISGNVEVTIVNYLGQTVKSFHTSVSGLSSHHIPVSDLPQGAYILQLNNGQHVISQRFQVSHNF